MQATSEHTKGFYLESQLKSLSSCDDTSDRIHIGVYHPDAGVCAEFSIAWDERNKPTLEAGSEAWGILYQMQDLLKLMATAVGLNITAAEFAERLKELGYKETVKRLPLDRGGLTSTLVGIIPIEIAPRTSSQGAHYEQH